MRGRRYKYRCGPLIVYEKNQKLVETFRNIPGIDFCRVNALNLLQLAPGGHIGRLIIWTKEAFSKLDNWLDGKKSPKIIMMNSDLQSLINSDEIQSVIRESKKNNKVIRKRNLLGKRKIRYETFRGFSLEEINTRKYKNKNINKKN